MHLSLDSLSISRLPYFCISILFLICFSAITPLYAQIEFFTPTISLFPGEQVARTRIEAPSHAQSHHRAAGFATDIQVSYSGFPVDEELAFQYAVDIWANEIFSTFPIEIEAIFQPIASGALASTTPVLVTGVSSGPIAGAAYPIAYANSEFGCDFRPLDADMVIIINSSIAWHTNTATLPGPTDYDLATVALHEIAHGLGIATVFEHGAIACGAAPFGCYTPALSVYDHFLEDGSTNSLSGKPNPSTALGFALTGNASGVFWNGGNAVTANSSIKPQIESPATFVAGESINHLDETVFPAGSPNSLMTSKLNLSEVIHDPGPIVRAMLKDMGWSLTDAAVSFFEVKPVGFTSLSQSFLDRSSQAVSWAWDFDNDGFTDATAQNPSFTFPAVGSYTITLTINGNPALVHTETIDIFNPPTIPYYNDFDTGSGGGFYCPSVTCDQWELGVASTSNFSTFNGGAIGGSGESWATNLASMHGNNTFYYLESPPFNLSGGTGDYFLRFNFVWVAASDAGMNMEFSTDGGNTWTILGGLQGTDPNADNDWYDAGSVASLENEIGWQKTLSNAVYAGSYRINALVGNTDVRFRLKFAAGSAFAFDGIQIDNFEIDGNVLEVEEEPTLPEPESLAFLLSPNPARDVLTLKIAESGSHQGSFRLIDMAGQQVLQQSFSFEDQLEVAFSVRDLPTGIYLYEWFDGRAVRRGKILKK